MQETTDEDLEMLSPNLQDNILKLQMIFSQIKKIEESFGLEFNLFINKNFVHSIYEWSCGKDFRVITQFTESLEGAIVRKILKVDRMMTSIEDNLDLIKRGSSRRSGKFTNTNVRSTITGMILTVPVEVGNSVIEANTFNDGTTIATVANMDQMIFEGKVDESDVGKVDESDVGKIRTGMDLILRIGAIEDETFLATLERISP